MMSHLLKRSLYILPSASGFMKLNYRSVFTSSKCRIPRSTIDSEEVEKFDSWSANWWHEDSFWLLHLANSLRVPLIRDGILSLAKCNQKIAKPLEGYSILDVGCGGGILSEPLARLGAKVTGLDPAANNIKAAIEHASKDEEIKNNITYVCDCIENLAATNNQFDAVVASEVIEHVDNISTFVHSCVELTKTNGSLFFTTINQTKLSYFVAILLAEYVLGYIPKGTHDWNKFVKPKELIEILESHNCRSVSLEGINYNPLTRKMSWKKNVDTFYALHAVKL